MELEYYKGISFTQHYSLHSTRSFYINKKLELGLPIAVVAKASGNNIRTIIKHYENLQVMDYTDDLVKQKITEHWEELLRDEASKLPSLLALTRIE